MILFNKKSTRTLFCAVGLQFALATTAHTADTQNTQNTPSNRPESIPWSQIGAKAGADYRGDGLSVDATETGARLHCMFQRMDGEATRQGLWLASTATNQPDDRFRVVATAVNGHSLSPEGTVTVDGQIVRFTRAELVEEYSVSMDGVRQDLIVPEKPANAGQLEVRLAVSGARVEPAVYGTQLVLERSGRKIAYSRLHVTDANGKELPARIEATPNSEITMAVLVDDTGALYPVRIDPTFSDANWVSMGGLNGAGGNVYSAAMDGSGNLYIGGTFGNAGTATANNVAMWNGTSWSALGSGMSGGYFPGPYVSALAVSGTTLYAGGNFTSADGGGANYIAQWDGNSWSPLGSGMNDQVNALAVLGTNLYAGGDFTTAGGNPAYHIAQWNGSSWAPLALGVNGTVGALAVSGTNLYVGGGFTAATNNGSLAVTATNVAQWNGIGWSALGSGVGDYVFALAVSGGTLYAGGQFTQAGSTTANYIAQWNGSCWSPLGGGLSASVYALAVMGGTLYAAGPFTTAGSNLVNHIAQWNGSSWSPLGSGLDSYANALAVLGTNLYAAGTFITAGGNPIKTIAQWNGSSWSALGSGIVGGSARGYGPNIFALATMGNKLYVGGDFTNAGGTSANSIAQWDGSTWSALGSGMTNNVLALAASGTNLYAGGHFTNAGGNAVNYIAQWNGSSWSPLGSGVNNDVLALAASGTNLYAGGYFYMAGGNPANYVAQWNGSRWLPMGSGMNSIVQAFAFLGGKLYVGGDFTGAGGIAANYIAQWDGNNWFPLGSGVNNGVRALAGSGGILYVGGDSITAGGKVSAYAAAATIGSLPAILSQPQSTNVMSGSAANFSVGANGQPLFYQWFKNGNGLLNGGNISGVTGGSLGLTNVYVNDPGLYLVVVSNNFGSVTSGVASLTVSNLPFLLTGGQGQGNLGRTSQPFWLTVDGPAGSNTVVYGSTDLQSWVPIATNPLSLGSLTFTDQLATNYPKRFYRIQLAP